MPGLTPARLLRLLPSKSEDFWQTRGSKAALNLFQAAARRVPAYREFLKKCKINPEKIRTPADLEKIPATSKENYLRQHPLEKLCWDGKLASRQWVFSATSGTSGRPFYFPRGESQDQEYALTAELYLKTNFRIHRRTTLYINGFALGAWIGGIFTYEAITRVARTGKYPLSLINPGLNKQEIISALIALGAKFDQVIIAGYPPFIKDLVDMCLEQGLHLEKYNLKFIFSAEGFSEPFRDYIIKNARLKNPFRDTLNHYGSVDLGTMAYETPISIFIRRLATEQANLKNRLFGDSPAMPTFAQYLPEKFYFQSQEQTLLCTSNSGLPLIRYSLGDSGETLAFGPTLRQLPFSDKELKERLKKVQILDTLWQLPFVSVFGRKEAAASWYGATIHAEHIKEAHAQQRVQAFSTGRFTMQLVSTKKFDTQLVIHSELKRNHLPDRQKTDQLQKTIIASLLKSNSEYKNNYSALPGKNTPKIKLWKHGEGPHFQNNHKQKWVTP